MKLLFFNSSLGSGGAERVLSTLANTFANKEGYEVSIATYNDAVEDFYPIDQKIKRIRFGSAVGTNKITKLFKRIQKLYRIRQIIQQEKPDVVLPLIIYTNIEVAIASIGLGTKVMVAEHNNYWAVKSKFFRILRLIAYRFATKTVVLTRRDKMIYDRYLNNVEVIGNPIVLRESSENMERNKTLICVGRLNKVKQFHHAIEAFSMIHHNHPEWRLQIAGAGSELEFLKLQAKRLDVESKVDLLGNISDIERLYANSGIFVLCSEYEGLPMVIGEAMLSGLPVVSYDCPTGPSEFIDDGINGILVTHNDIKELAEKIEGLITDPEKRLFLANNAKEKIKAFSTDQIIEKWEKLFSQEAL